MRSYWAHDLLMILRKLEPEYPTDQDRCFLRTSGSLRVIRKPIHLLSSIEALSEGKTSGSVVLLTSLLAHSAGKSSGWVRFQYNQMDHFCWWAGSLCIYKIAFTETALSSASSGLQEVDKVNWLSCFFSPTWQPGLGLLPHESRSLVEDGTSLLGVSSFLQHFLCRQLAIREVSYRDLGHFVSQTSYFLDYAII